MALNCEKKYVRADGQALKKPFQRLSIVFPLPIPVKSFSEFEE